MAWSNNDGVLKSYSEEPTGTDKMKYGSLNSSGIISNL